MICSVIKISPGGKEKGVTFYVAKKIASARAEIKKNNNLEKYGI